jgi:hypothetical protein
MAPVLPIAQTANSVQGRLISSIWASKRSPYKVATIYKVAAKHKGIWNKIGVNKAWRARRYDRIERPDRYLQRPRHGKAGLAKAGIAVDGALGDVVVSSKRGTASNCYVRSGSWPCENSNACRAHRIIL